MKIDFLSKGEKKDFLEKLEEQFGIESLPFLLFKLGRERIYGYSGSLSKEELSILSREINIEKIGIYLATEEKEGIRLSFDFPSLLKEQINKNIVEIDEKQAEEWLRGKDLMIENKIRGFVILKYKNDFLGCGKASQGRITNFVPKERRIKH